MKKGIGRVIIRRTDALAQAMQLLPIREKTGREIAFQIAELSPEFEFMVGLIKKAENGRAPTIDELKELHGMIRFHWPMHLRPLRSAILRALDEIEAQATSKPKKRALRRSVGRDGSRRVNPSV
jgi:hypothetical protein